MEDYIQRDFQTVIKERYYFTDYFIQMCKTNLNEPQNIPVELKYNIRKTALEIILC